MLGHGTEAAVRWSQFPQFSATIVQRLASNDATSQDGRLINCGQEEEKKESDSERLRIARNRFMLDERLDC
jgi:hypothetical protein